MSGYSLRQTSTRLQNKMEQHISEICETLTALSGAVSDISKEVVDFKQAFIDLKASLENKVDAIGKTVENNTQEVLKLRALCGEQNKTISSLKEENHAMQAKIKDMEQKQQDIILEMHHQEFRSRSFNIRIVGLAEHRDENTLELASHFLREKQLLTPEQNVHECIETAHRVGKRSPENKKTRSIVMRFFRRPDVFRILTDVKQKSVNKNSDIKIVKDRTKRELETRKLAYNQLKAAWENGIPATVNKNLLLVIYGRITPIERN